MAKTNVSVDSNVNLTPPPPPLAVTTGSGNSGPTGTSGFFTMESTMSALQSNAGDLQARVDGIATGLQGLNVSPTALGPIGLFVVPSLNTSNNTAIAQAEAAAKALGDVKDGLRATQQTTWDADSANASLFKGIDTGTDLKPPPGTTPPPPPRPGPQDGSKVAPPPGVRGGDVDLESGHDSDSSSADTSDYDADSDTDPKVDPFKMTPEEFKEHFKTNPNGAWFWSGRYPSFIEPDPSYTYSVEGKAGNEAFYGNGTTLKERLNDHNLEMPNFWDRTPEAKQIWADASKHFSDHAEGTVYAVLGPERRGGNVFDTIELPALQDNPKVERVVAIDPFTGKQELIYSRDGVTAPSSPAMDPVPSPAPAPVPQFDLNDPNDDAGYEADTERD